ncbi:hypothetical protein BJ741DRAFT_603466 [Chytriomyces cf. hyalinus JEL632]|nr:hypothetical protein BJ741DRAFT_603466 [Chytriomyces cf. hyalinus JEL632]
MLRPPLPSEDHAALKHAAINTAATFNMLDSLMDSITDEIAQIHIEVGASPHKHRTPSQQQQQHHNRAPETRPALESVSLEHLLQSNPRLTGFLSKLVVNAGMAPHWVDVFAVLASEAVLYVFSSDNTNNADAMPISMCRGHYDTASDTWLLILSSSTSPSFDWTFQCKNSDAYQQWLDTLRKSPSPQSRQVKRPERLVTTTPAAHTHHRHHRTGSFSSQTTTDSYPSPSSVSSPRPHGMALQSPTDSHRLESRSGSRGRPPRSASASDESTLVSSPSSILKNGPPASSRSTSRRRGAGHTVCFQETVAVISSDSSVSMHRQHFNKRVQP